MAKPTLVNLETALWVERTGSFSATARKLNASQPAISGRIRELEASLNFRIFTRRGHLMFPTPQGREFLDRIEPHVREIQAVLGDANADSGASGVVRVGAGHVALTWLVRVLDSQVKEAANFRYEISVERVPTLVALLEQDKLDLGLLPAPIQHPRFDCVLIGREPMLWLMAADRTERFSGYPRRSAPALAELLNEGPLWLPHKTSPYFARQTELLRAKGAHLRNINVCSDILRIADLIASTGGLGLVPKSLVTQRLAQGGLQPVEGLDDSEAEVYAVKRRSDNRAILHRLVGKVEAEAVRVGGTDMETSQKRSPR